MDKGESDYVGSDIFANRDSYDCALLAAGGTLRAIDAMYNGTCYRAFAAVRPPGHHADCSHAAGFCFFNNVAIGVKYV